MTIGIKKVCPTGRITVLEIPGRTSGDYGHCITYTVLSYILLIYGYYIGNSSTIISKLKMSANTSCLK